MQLEVELHAAVDQLVLEMQIAQALAAGDLDFRQREVVSADQPDRAAAEQSTNDALRADEAVLRIRALQNLVEQEQQRRRPRGKLVELA